MYDYRDKDLGSVSQIPQRGIDGEKKKGKGEEEGRGKGRGKGIKTTFSSFKK